MKKYPSKISYGLLSILLLVLIGSTIPLIFPPIWPGLIINFLLLLFVIYIFSTTYYLVDEGFLIVKSGFIINKKTDINTVKSIKETSSLLSAPALSFDRLEVNYENMRVSSYHPRTKMNLLGI